MQNLLNEKRIFAGLMNMTTFEPKLKLKASFWLHNMQPSMKGGLCSVGGTGMSQQRA